eukprot:TRINITY_DN531_c1_g1_i1.p1 TRINITY_DN531_c1_g1~~TRINITY_DN531_c1_g1_i1.p1  ORF type:complete len:632 (-),score=243.92 TRINITY_DN531_c1_g1_i1:69-1964(-)
MLDFFLVLSKGGLLLWRFQVEEIGMSASEMVAFVNGFLRSVVLEERASSSEVYKQDSTALKCGMDNEFDLLYVLGYQSYFQLQYADKLLDEIRLRFRDRFSSILLKNGSLQYSRERFNSFGDEFQKAYKQILQDSKKSSVKMKSYEQSAKSKKTVRSMIIPKNEAAAKAEEKENKKPKEKEESPGLSMEQRMANLKALEERRKKKGGASPQVRSPKASDSSEVRKGKKGTTWDEVVYGSNRPISSKDMAKLERGPKSTADHEALDHQLNQFVPDMSVVGASKDIKFIEDFEDEFDDDEEEEEFMLKSDQVSQKGGIWSALSSLVGSKSLTAADIQPVITQMQDHLISKNVAADVSVKLCESISLRLRGKVMGTFSTIRRTVKDTLTESLVKLLTPKRRIDIIRDVHEAKRSRHPYVMTFCGVNGVGKSTNLAKICFWLIENNCRVLIAACDTFRAGAVEQLRTHTKRLNSLHSNGGETQMVELYEKGYGKDAAGIALEAINYARTARIDVVLVDTAGRMQDNEPLMRALSKLISVNAPDLVLFVGEALVGNEAVDQLVKFNAALADHSSQDNPHLIDGIVLTKFDTIDDKVGTAISMTYITGQPILFVGTGQTYTDLKALNAKAVVQALMK